MPGKAKNSVASQLIQGSDLAVSAASSRQGLAVAWLRAFLDPAVQDQFARTSGYLPALASAVKQLKGDPVTEAQADLADKGRFTPAAAGWVDAEAADPARHASDDPDAARSDVTERLPVDRGASPGGESPRTHW